MPYASEKLHIPHDLKRSVRLTEDNAAKMKMLHAEGASIRSLAKMFKVSRRLVQFTLFPERRERCLEHRKNRKYNYGTEYNTAQVRESRRYKQSLYKAGELEE